MDNLDPFQATELIIRLRSSVAADDPVALAQAFGCQEPGLSFGLHALEASAAAGAERCARYLLAFGELRSKCNRAALIAFETGCDELCLAFLQALGPEQIRFWILASPFGAPGTSQGAAGRLEALCEKIALSQCPAETEPEPGRARKL